MISKLILM